jgi:hypothetical protein
MDAALATSRSDVTPDSGGAIEVRARFMRSGDREIGVHLQLVVEQSPYVGARV